MAKGARKNVDGAAEEAIAAIARRLRAGEITSAQAVEILIDEVARTAADPEGTRAKLRELLRRQTEIDPYLLARIARLGKPS